VLTDVDRAAAQEARRVPIPITGSAEAGEAAPAAPGDDRGDGEMPRAAQG